MENALKKFGIGYAGLTLLLGALSILLLVYAEIDLGSSTTIAALVGAALWAGQGYAVEFGDVPDNRTSWRFAILGFFISLAISAVFAVIIEIIFRVFTDQSLFAVFAELPASMFIIALVVIGLLNILALRFFFPFAVKTHLKNLKK